MALELESSLNPDMNPDLKSGILKAICPLCEDNKISHYYSDRSRDYLRCSNCGLIFVPESFHLEPGAEKSRYDLHQNSPEDEGYRRFLFRLAGPLLKRLKPGQSGLDFGCGPGPVLSIMLEEAGYPMSLYDPFYNNNLSVLENSYDFVTATEVAEHFSLPGIEFKRLFGMLKEGGTLGIMTKLVLDLEAFTHWHYIQDDTHIAFYSRRSFEYLAGLYDAYLEFIGKDVIFMRKRVRG
ncbi:MAG: class I SAM-dependent methyltransferase [Spirochaetales bacterium]|nr:class I SAM-dependent methyltransferase [Spirochaetales bacterium]